MKRFGGVDVDLDDIVRGQRDRSRVTADRMVVDQYGDVARGGTHLRGTQRLIPDVE